MESNEIVLKVYFQDNEETEERRLCRSDTGRGPRQPTMYLLQFVQTTHGEVQEWLNWPLSKSGKPQGFEGSNPSLSAILITI